MNPIHKVLSEGGPARAGRLVSVLTESQEMSPQAARQRLSRARSPVERYPRRLLPKREAFFYLREQRNTERYWDNLLRDLRETASVFGCAIDGLRTRGGVVPVDEFATISGAPVALKKQIPSEGVSETLIDLGVMERQDFGVLGECFVANPYALIEPLESSEIRVRRLTEGVMLDGLREWIRKNGIGSYDKIAIREEDNSLMVGQFKWDMTGPSYFLPVRRVRRKGTQNGFVVADVFEEDWLDIHAIRYFIRKVQTYQKTSNSGALFPILMARCFTGEALKEGHRVGLMLTTPTNLFGDAVAEALTELTQTLRNAAAVVAVDGDRLHRLLEQLTKIEGRSGNMRGILFELIAAHIAKREIGGNIDLGILHSHRRTGEKADLDVVCVTNRHSVHVIECKGKGPGVTVSLQEVEEWLRKIPIMGDYVESQNHLRTRKQTYEFWTTGTFEPCATAKLKAEEKNRTKRPIAWKDGNDIRKVTAEQKLKTIGDALDQHFMKHPLAH